MSLINDALKRVGQKRSGPKPGDGAPLQPVADHSGSNGSSSPGLLVVVLIVAVLGAGGWFGWSYYSKKKAGTTTTTAGGTNKTTQTARTGATNAAGKGATNAAARTPGKTNAPQQVASAKPAAPTATDPKPAQPTTAATPPAATGAVNPGSVLPAASTTGFPQMKLQGIFYRLSKPSAVINGETVFVGDKVKDTQAKIAAIERTNVTVELDGQKMVLSLK